jgi:glycogen synthase
MTRALRVLAIGSLYPPHHEGGYELSWHGAMRHLRARGHTVRVLASDHRRPGVVDGEDPDVHRELRMYWRDHAFLHPGWRERILLERENAASLARHLQELRPHVVSLWPMGGMSLSLLERLRRAGVPTLAMVEDDWLVYGPRADRWLHSPLVRRAPAAWVERASGLPARVDWARAARYLFVSEHTRRRALARRALPDTAVLPIGIEERFLAAREPPAWRWSLLYVGRLDPRKGTEDALAALARLPSQATLTLAGTGDAAHERALRARAGEGVRFAGAIGHQQLPGLYAQADAVLFPVRWEEPWGLVPLEAMGMGRPVIATGLGGSGEYLEHEANCLLVPPGDPPAIAAAVRRLAEEEGLRERLRTGGARTAREHTAEAFHRRLEEELRAMAQNPPR